MALGENESGQVLRLGEKLRLAGKIAGEEVLEDAAVGRIGHGEGCGGVMEGTSKRLKRGFCRIATPQTVGKDEDEEMQEKKYVRRREFGIEVD